MKYQILNGTIHGDQSRYWLSWLHHLMSLISPTHRRFIKLAKTGLVQNETFVFYLPQSIFLKNIRSFEVKQCDFVWKLKEPRYFVQLKSSFHVLFEFSNFFVPSHYQRWN